MTTTDKPAKRKQSSSFRTAADEVSDRPDREPRQNEGSHGDARQGRIVQTPGEAQPYKVVLQDHRGIDTEHPFSTMKEAEAFIRSKTPAPPKRDTSRDQPPTSRN